MRKPDGHRYDPFTDPAVKEIELKSPERKTKLKHDRDKKLEEEAIKFVSNYPIEEQIEKLYRQVRQGNIYGFVIEAGSAYHRLLIRSIKTPGGSRPALHEMMPNGMTASGRYEGDPGVRSEDDMILKLIDYVIAHPDATVTPCPEYQRT